MTPPQPEWKIERINIGMGDCEYLIQRNGITICHTGDHSFALLVCSTMARDESHPTTSPEELREAYQNGFTDGQSKAAIENERINAAIIAKARDEGRHKVLVALQGWRYKAMNGTLKKDVWKKWNEETELIESLRISSTKETTP